MQVHKAETKSAKDFLRHLKKQLNADAQRRSAGSRKDIMRAKDILIEEGKLSSSAPKSEPETKPETKPAPKPETKPAPKSEPKPEPKPVPKPEPKPAPKPEPKPAPKPEPVPKLEPELVQVPEEEDDDTRFPKDFKYSHPTRHIFGDEKEREKRRLKKKVEKQLKMKVFSDNEDDDEHSSDAVPIEVEAEDAENFDIDTNRPTIKDLLIAVNNLKAEIQEIRKDCRDLGTQQDEFGKDMFILQEDVIACSEVLDELEEKQKQFLIHGRVLAFCDLQKFRKYVGASRSTDEAKQVIEANLPRTKAMLTNIFGEEKAASLTHKLEKKPTLTTFIRTATRIEQALDYFDIPPKISQDEAPEKEEENEEK